MDNKENQHTSEENKRNLVNESDNAFIQLWTHSFNTVSQHLEKRKSDGDTYEEEEEPKLPRRSKKKSTPVHPPKASKKDTALRGFLKSYKCKAIKKNKKTFFDFLKKNQIIDLTDESKDSMYQNLPPAQKALLKTTVTLKEAMVPGLSTIFSKHTLSSLAKAKALLKEVEEFKAKNAQARAQKAVATSTLKMNVYKSYMFSQKYIKSYSELDFVVKFWSPVIEEYLSSPSLTLHWGETKAKKTKTDAKLDLRVLSAPNTSKADLAICEFAKTAFSSKLYYDKIKSVLLTKYQLNSWVSSGISPWTIRIPIIQVMGLVCQVMVLRCQENGVYVLDPVSIFRFPSTFKDIEENGIHTLINNLDYLKTSCETIKELNKNASHTKEQTKLEKVLGKHNAESNTNWTTNVIWFKGDDDEEDEKEDEENEEEDKEDEEENEEDEEDEEDEKEDEEDEKEDKEDEEENEEDEEEEEDDEDDDNV